MTAISSQHRIARMGFALVALVVALVVLAMPAVAVAAPYRLFAKYNVLNDSICDKAVDAFPCKTITVPVDGGGPPLPLYTSDLELEGVYFQVDTSATDELSHIDRFVVSVNCLPPECPAPFKGEPQSVKATDKEAKRILQVTDLRSRSVGATGRFPDIHVDVILSSAFICSAEMELRRDKGKPICVEPTSPPVGKTPAAKPAKTEEAKPPICPANKELPELPLVKPDDPAAEVGRSLILYQGLMGGDGAPIYFSFCEGMGKAIDYTQLAGGNQSDGEKRHTSDKNKLAKLLLEHLSGATALGAIKYSMVEEVGEYASIKASDDVGLVTNDTFGSDFDLTEDGRALGEPRDHGIDNVDQGATLRLAPRKGANVAAVKNMVAYFDYTDSKGNSAHTKVDLVASGQAWTLKYDLHDLLNSRVRIGIYYKLAGHTTLILEQSAYVRNLGLITSFPVISEVVTALTKKSTKLSDLAGQSSIPLSFAVPWNGTKVKAAVTFPWMLGFNPRSAPTAADYFKVFAGVSVVLPVANDPNDQARPAIGGGVSLCNAFAFSVNTTIQDKPTGYVMIGISPPDLVKTFQPASGG